MVIEMSLRDSQSSPDPGRSYTDYLSSNGLATPTDLEGAGVPPPASCLDDPIMLELLMQRRREARSLAF